MRTDGSRADAYLDESFHQKPHSVQWQFWTYCVLKLLRPAGYFSLHTAALVSPEGRGMLVAGPSGVGKSTIAIALVRAGWGYLSDDAVLLRRDGTTVTALPLRKQFYVDADAASTYADMRLGAVAPDATGDMRREVHLDDCYGHLRAAQAMPVVLVFPTIVDTEHSAAVPLDEATALYRLLAASGPQLFDRAHMNTHLATLRAVVRQSASYRVDAGRDLSRHPARVLELIPGGGRA